MNRYMIQLAISLLFLMLPFVAAGLFSLRGKRNRSASVPRTNKVAGITEVIILLSAGIVCLSCFAFVDPGVYLHLGEMRQAYASAHIIVFLITGILVLFGLLISWKGRTSWAVIFLMYVIFFYFMIIRPSAFSGPSYIMSMIAPKDSWVPIENYTFNVNEDLEGAEVWINGVFLGTTPFTITAREFNKKVPFLNEPPEGYSSEGFERPNGDWFRFSFLLLEKKENMSDLGISYVSGFQDYYAKIKYAGEWGKNCSGGGGGGGGPYQYDYEVSLSGSFSVTDKIKHARQERFNKLIQKARLANYQVNKAWLETIDTYGDRGLSKIRELAKTEKEFSDVLDKWVECKYNISDSMTQKQASILFNDICRKIDEQRIYSNDSFEGMSAALIYDKLNVEDLIKRYIKLIKARPSGYSPMSSSVVFQALKSWDTKLKAEDSNTPNIIEKKLVPALIVNNAVDSAIPFGGPDIDRFLIRQYKRNPLIEGIKLGPGNYEHTMGMQINKWLYNLALEKSPAAEKFREKNRREILKLAKLMTNTNFNHEKKPPEFLFYDINLGKQSMAYEYWPEYSANVETSFPPRWNEKLKKRFQYLNKLGSLATEDMYLQCWKTTKKLDDLIGGNTMDEAIEAIDLDKRIPVAKEIIKDIEKYLDAKRAALKTEQERNLGFRQDRYLVKIKKSLAQIGDEESIQWWLSELKPAPDNFEPQRFKEMVQYENLVDEPIINALAQNENPDIRILSLEAIRKYPSASNREILEKLLNDGNEEVRSAAQQVADEHEEIKNTPVNDLISEPKGN